MKSYRCVEVWTPVWRCSETKSRIWRRTSYYGWECLITQTRPRLQPGNLPIRSRETPTDEDLLHRTPSCSTGVPVPKGNHTSSIGQSTIQYTLRYGHLVCKVFESLSFESSDSEASVLYVWKWSYRWIRLFLISDREGTIFPGLHQLNSGLLLNQRSSLSRYNVLVITIDNNLLTCKPPSVSI